MVGWTACSLHAPCSLHMLTAHAHAQVRNELDVVDRMRPVFPDSKLVQAPGSASSPTR